MASVQDIFDEINRIENAKDGISEAIEEKGVQVPAGMPIQEYPGLVRQIQTGSPDAVLYTPQELTPEQQEQARENIGAYKKPETGIPKSDLADGVQRSLEKADAALQPGALTPITELIPAQATPQNQLADKNFVNSSVATNTANYISDNGQPFQSVEDLEAYTGQLTNNDYAFVVGTDSAGNTIYTRYKYNANTQTWAAEYVLNNSSFTAEQWAAISSGITALLVQKLSNLPTEVVTYVSQTLTEAQKEQARRNIGAAPDGGSSEVAESALSVLAQDALVAYYTFRRTAGGAKIGNGLGRIAEVRGKSLVWNQYVRNGDFSNGTTGWVDSTGTLSVSNGIASITPSDRYVGARNYPVDIIPEGHKFIVSAFLYQESVAGAYIQGSLRGTNIVISLGSETGVWRKKSAIFTAGTGSVTSVGFASTLTSGWSEIKATKFQILDLTSRFGAGNEPATVEDFEALYSLPYYAYNVGQIINNKTQAIDVVGINQWDEEWEYDKYWWPVDGVITQHAGTGNLVINKYPIPVLPNTTYYLTCGKFDADGRYNYQGYFNVKCADANMNELPITMGNYWRSFTTPSGAAYIFFNLSASYGAAYKGDVCINLSDPSFNGRYAPYKMNTVALNLTTLTGKLNGEGDSVVVFPDGLKSAGSVYDEIVGKKAIKRMGKHIFTGQETIILSNWRPADGTYAVIFAASAIPGFKTNNQSSPGSNSILVGSDVKSYNSIYNGNIGNTLYTDNYSLVIRVPSSIATDNASLLAWLTGKEIIYELAEPLVYELDESIEKTFEVEAGGTERRLPEDTATVVNAPFYGTVQYPIALQPKDTISNDSLTALLAALKSAGKIANYTMTWDAATNSYKFTIS